jgi:chromate reductase, NAD(P)H dehydrogenase (quinone)
MAPRILVFAGSTRTDSLNKRLARHAADVLRNAGAEATLLDLRDLALPLYDGDLEARDGLPVGAKRLKELMKAHQAFVIASPEYNSSIPAVLKNAIDWASRAEPNEKALVAFQGKVALLLAASPGLLGGLRALVHLRSILGNIGVIVLPEQLAVSKAHEAFDDQGRLADEKQRGTLARHCATLVTIATKLA